MTAAPTTDHLIAERWHRGDTIAETRTAVKYATGVDPGFERVRRIFVDLSHEASPQGAPA